MAENQIVVYRPNETMRLDVRLENETVWLNRHQMAQLFGRDVKTIGKHIANALKEELSDLSAAELSHDEGSSAVVAKSATTREGNMLPTVAKFATVQKELIVIDPYVGVTTLDMLAKRGRGVKIELVTRSNGKNGRRNHSRASRFHPQGDIGTPRIRQRQAEIAIAKGEDIR